MTLAFDMVATPRPGLKGPLGRSFPLAGGRARRALWPRAEREARGEEVTIPLTPRDSRLKSSEQAEAFLRGEGCWNLKSRMGDQS